MFQEGFFDKVYYRFWQTDKENTAFANIFAIHGLGGHSFWFNNAANLFNKNNINFFSFDLQGFGESKYPKGTISSYKDWVSISKEILEKFLVNFNITVPVFILGHSMGALIAILLSKKVKSNGWILTVPGFEGYEQTWPLFDFTVPVFLKSLCRPTDNVSMPFGPELITKNKETQLQLKKDKLRVVNVNAEVFKEVYFLTLKSKALCKSFDEPVLMLQAGNDMVCSNSAMDKYFNDIRSKDKSKKTYTNVYHDLFIEDEVEQIVNDITEWIRVRAL